MIGSKLIRFGSLAVVGGGGAALAFQRPYFMSAHIEGPKPLAAVAIVGPLTNQTEECRGTVLFKQAGSDGAPTRVIIHMTGLRPGKHGFQEGTSTHTTVRVGGIVGFFDAFVPFHVHIAPHGGLHDPPTKRHIGDLGNITADATGSVDVEFDDVHITLRGPHSIIGRSVVVHADEDDLGRGTHADSATTGHSGARVACGVIGIADAAA